LTVSDVICDEYYTLDYFELCAGLPVNITEDCNVSILCLNQIIISGTKLEFALFFIADIEVRFRQPSDNWRKNYGNPFHVCDGLRCDYPCVHTDGLLH
jgi:hypothetical protein